MGKWESVSADRWRARGVCIRSSLATSWQAWEVIHFHSSAKKTACCWLVGPSFRKISKMVSN